MSDPQLDLVVRGGTVVTEEGQRQADVGIRDGRIASIHDRDGGAPSEPTGAAEIDATGRLLLPGGVDPHVHLHMEGLDPGEPDWVDDYTSGSQAALAGGITSLGNMSYVLPWESIADRVRAEEIAGRAPGDRGRLLPHRHRDPRPRRSSTRSARRCAGGQSSMKIFMCMPTFDAHVPQFTRVDEGGGRRGRDHARPLRGSGHHRVLHDDAHRRTRTATSATSPRAARSRRRWSPPSARSRCAARRARRPTSSTCRRRARWRPARRRARRACRCSSRRARFTCT